MKIKRNIFRIKILIILLAILINFIFILDGEATLVIDPAFIKIDLSGKRSSGDFLLKNTGEEEIRYRAKAVYFTLHADGGLAEVTPDEYSLTDWIKFNPKEFTLPPKSSRAVRYFIIIPPGKLLPREYRGAIEFTPLKTAKIQSQDNEGHKFNLQVVSIILVPVYGYVKNTKYSGTLSDILVDNGKDEVVISSEIFNTNDGILRLNGEYQITAPSGKKIEGKDFKKVVVFQKNKRTLKTTIKKPAEIGQYVVRLHMKSYDRRAPVELTQETKFNL